MGALSFNYSVIPDSKKAEKYFEYKWIIPLKEYRLRYERYAALSDASIFNAPVAVTKVATGVCLYDLFIEKPKEARIFRPSDRPVFLPSNARYQLRDNFLQKCPTLSLWAKYTARKANGSILNVFPNTQIKRITRNKIFLDDRDIFFMYRLNSIYRHPDILIPPAPWSYHTNAFPPRAMYPDGKDIPVPTGRTIAKPLPYYKIPFSQFINVFKGGTIPPVNIALGYEVKRTGIGWVIYPNRIVVRIKDSITSLLTDIGFVFMYDFKAVNDTFVSSVFNNEGNADTYDVFSAFNNEGNAGVYDGSSVLNNEGDADIYESLNIRRKDQILSIPSLNETLTPPVDAVNDAVSIPNITPVPRPINRASETPLASPHTTIGNVDDTSFSLATPRQNIGNADNPPLISHPDSIVNRASDIPPVTSKDDEINQVSEIYLATSPTTNLNVVAEQKLVNEPLNAIDNIENITIQMPHTSYLNISGLNDNIAISNKDITLEDGSVSACIDDKIANVNYDNLNGKYDKYSSINQNAYQAYKGLKNSNVIRQIITSSGTNGRTIWSTSLIDVRAAFKSFHGTNVFEQVLGANRGSKGYLGVILDPCDYACDKSKTLEYYQNFILNGYKDTKQSHINYDSMSSKDEKQGNVSYNLTGNKGNKQSNVNDSIMGNKHRKRQSLLPLFFANKDRKGFSIKRDDFLYGSLKDAMLPDYVFGNKNRKGMDLHDDIAGEKFLKEAFEQEQYTAFKDKKSMTILNDLFAQKFSSKMNLYSNLTTTKLLQHGYLFYHAFGQKFSKRLELYSDISSTNRSSKNITFYNSPVYANGKYKDIVDLYDIFARNNRKQTAYWNKTSPIQKTLKQGVYHDDIFTSSVHIPTGVHSDIVANDFGTSVTYHNSIFARDVIRPVAFFSHTSITKDPWQSDIFKDEWTSGGHKNVHIESLEWFNKIMSSDSSSLEYFPSITATQERRALTESKGYCIKGLYRPLCELNLADFSIKTTNHLMVLDNIPAVSIDDDLSLAQEVWTSNHVKDISDMFSGIEIRHTGKDITKDLGLNTSIDKILGGLAPTDKDETAYLSHKPLTLYSIVKAVSTGRDLSIYDDEFTFHGNHILDDLPPLITPFKESHDITLYVNILLKRRQRKISVLDRRPVLIPIGERKIRLYNYIVPVTRDKMIMEIWSGQDNITRIKYGMDIIDVGEWTEVIKNLTIYDTDRWLGIIRKGFPVDYSGISVYREVYNLNREDFKPWSLYRESYPLDLYQQMFIGEEKNLSIWDSTIPFIKEKRNLSIQENMISFIKSVLPAIATNYLKYPNWSTLGGFIVPVSKVRNQASIDSINLLLKKYYQNVMINEDSFSSVLSKPAIIDYDMGATLDTKAKNVFMDYINDMLMKAEFQAQIQEGMKPFSKHYYAQLQEEILWLKASPKFAALGFDEFTSTTYKPIMIDFHDAAKSFTKDTYVHIFPNEWLDIPPKVCYYSYDTWGLKGNSKAFIEPQCMATTDIREVFVEDIFGGTTSSRKAMLQFGNFEAKQVNKMWYENGVFSDTAIKEFDIFQQLLHGFKDKAELDILPNDFGNWVWVYETPDPFLYDKYGIDELLLPENDTQYENFEDLIFDREHMRPRDPIKEISETQWIAKLPIRHPVDKYKDVGKVYEDSAFKWQNYFGIPASVIHDMALRYYRIWEKNMFKFSTMTMQQAGNLMLNYLWDWIPEYYPIGQLEQAYRVFRLIRWYTECAVINNSQYIISYEYANLTWPDADHMSICHIPNDLQEYDPSNVMENSNDTMYSDTTPGHLCLRNNPIYTRSNDVWVTFRIENKRNTTITFNLYNQSGSVNIYVNDELVEVIRAHGSHKLAYNIRYTGDINEFKIEKKAADNLDNYFIIGNISIAHQAFKDLSIQFDPALRAGNKPLNEVAEKFGLFASLYDDKNIAYKEILSKNLSVSEVYKMLKKYWELHHENKWKGKRLTIKQV